MHLPCLAALAATALATLAVAQAPVAPPVPKESTAGLVAAKPAMWIVKDADTTIYLFGTVHLLDPKYRWFEGTVKAAFDKSDELVIEALTPPDAEAQPLVFKLATDPDGRTLPQRLGPKLAERYGAELVKAGMSPTTFDKYEPWFAAMTLSVIQYQQLGFTVAAGVEPALIAAARTAKKPVEGLEDFEQQLGFLDSMPEADQIRFVEVGVDQAAEAPVLARQLMTAWATGDDKALAAVMNEGMEELPALRKTLLDDRNVRWADWIARRMVKPGTVFVAVGAGHLGGKGSVQNQLATRGLKARRAN